MRKLLPILILMTLPACAVTLQAYDPSTVAHVDRTIEARNKDFDALCVLIDLALKDVKSPAVVDQVRRGLQHNYVLQKSELSRLRSFRDYEADKAKAPQ